MTYRTTEEIAEEIASINSIRLKRMELSRYLVKLKIEYLAEHEIIGYDIDGFLEWVEQKYGIRVSLNHNGQINGNYDIINDDRYIWLVLKHKT